MVHSGMARILFADGILCPLSVAEFWFTQIVELLHVPLQSLYTYKQRLEEFKRQRPSRSAKTTLSQDLQESGSRNMENGHSFQAEPLK